MVERVDLWETRKVFLNKPQLVIGAPSTNLADLTRADKNLGKHRTLMIIKHSFRQVYKRALKNSADIGFIPKDLIQGRNSVSALMTFILGLAKYRSTLERV